MGVWRGRWCSQENGNVYVGIGGQVTVTPAPTEPQGDPQEGAGEPQQEGAAPTATSTSKAGETTLPLCRCGCWTCWYTEVGGAIR